MVNQESALREPEGLPEGEAAILKKPKSSRSLGSEGGASVDRMPEEKKAERLTCFHSAALRKGVLRATLVASLIVAAGVTAGLAYQELRQSELRAAEGTYESISKSAMFGAKEIWRRKLGGSEVMATWMAWALPNSADWPLLDVNGYMPIGESVATLTSSHTQSLVVFVKPSEVADVEANIKALYAREGRPEEAGVSDFGFGIWKPDLNETPEYEDARLPDTTGENVWGGSSSNLAALLLHNKPASASLLYNLYSEEDRGIHIDSMVSCAKKNAQENTTKSCYAVTDILELKAIPGPAAVLFQPIYPANNKTDFVAFAVVSLNWAEVLTSTVPDYVSGLRCVVSTATRTVTYEIRNGDPVLIGDGDLHDKNYEHYGRSVVLNDISSGTETSAVYTLTVYPTEAMLGTFITNTPLKIAISFVAVITVCSLLFVFYDFLMRREANERVLVLEMKRRFVRFISHEIRTPLNTVCMGLELLDSELSQKGEIDWAQGTEDDIEFWRSVTSDVRENADVAVSILNDLLNYDKLESGSLKLETDPVNIWDLIKRTVQQFQIQAINKKVDVKFSLEKPKGAFTDPEDGSEDHELLNVVGDDVRLGQVIRNVISNALKFTPAGGCIEVTAEYDLTGLPNAKPIASSSGEACTFPRSGAVRILIKDSGIGLSDEQLSQLFAEGVQFDANKLQHGGGSGLGLNIAKGIVEQHQGRIWADSEGVGEGTSFFIELPLYAVPLEALKTGDDKASTASPSTTHSDGSLEEPNRNPLKILVAEDAESSRKMLMRLLERSGFSCIPASNGQEAVDAIAADVAIRAADASHIPIDTVLMDYEMPVLKGPEATRKLRDMGYKGLIIGVTGNVMDEDVQFFMDHGADEVIPKPISLQRLKECWEKNHRSKK